MNLGFVIRLFLAMAVFGVCLYFYIDKVNELTELRLRIVPLAKEAQTLREENVRLQYLVDQFESPAHLMELARKPEFAHLKHPLVKDILVLPLGTPIAEGTHP